MADLYKNKYRISSARHQSWDYRWAGAYFITICTHEKVPYFGKIQDGKMELSRIGVVADLLWYEIKNHAKFVKLGEFVVMPNHVHGVLILPDDGVTKPKVVGSSRFQNIGKNSISSIVGGYKSAVTKHANRLGFDFKWQTRFYDHIIRNDKAFQYISNYIVNNPKNWKEDKFYVRQFCINML